MSIASTVFPEFDNEMKITRRIMERVPSGKAEWKPHPKSFSIGHLNQLLSWMPGWITQVLTNTELVLGGAPGYSTEKTETLLAQFDKNVAEARAALLAATDSDFAVEWSMKVGGQVVWSGARSEIVRNTISHLAHHRGQMSVYLRLLDIPVPSVYGPTADEAWGG